MEISPLIIAGISFGLIFLTLFTGMYIFVALGISGLISAAIFQHSWAAMPYILFDSTNSFILTAILTFVFMGEVLYRSGATMKLFRGAVAILKFVPGSLYHAVIFASAIFAATCGSSAASAATIGRIALPELLDRGYNKRLALGTIAGGSTLANLIPPSLGFIVYGACTQESVSRLFMAGVIPGVIIALMMMIYVVIIVKIHPEYIKPSPPVSFKQSFKDVLNLIPIFGIIVVVLGSIYRGIATPTEAGTVGALSALILSAIYKKLNWKIIKESGFAAVKVTSMVMMLFTTAYIMGSVFGAMRVPKIIMEWVATAGFSPLMVLIGVIVIYTIMGFFMETLPVLVLTIGIVYPLMMNLGYDGIWFGVVATIILAAGMITPPVGICLYVTQALPPTSSLIEVSHGCLIFCVILYIMAALLIIWPELATWLPNMLM